MTDELDIELFIEEVKKHPEIWDVAAEEYHDRIKKRGAWIDICRKFVTTFDEMEEREKNEICKYNMNYIRSIFRYIINKNCGCNINKISKHNFEQEYNLV